MRIGACRGVAAAVALLSAILFAFGAIACGGTGFFRQYEYEEELYLSLDGSATMYVNSSIAALNALRGTSFDAAPAARFDRDAYRRYFSSPNTHVTRVSSSRRSGRRFVHVRLEVDDVGRLGEAAPFAWSAYRFEREGDLFVFKQTIAARLKPSRSDRGAARLEPSRSDTGGARLEPSRSDEHPPSDPDEVSDAASRPLGPEDEARVAAAQATAHWTGKELVAFRLHLPSKIEFHNTKREIGRGNILVWEQPLGDRLRGEPLVLEARMQTQSILYRTLWLFGLTFVLAALTFVAVIWWVVRRGKPQSPGSAQTAT